MSDQHPAEAEATLYRCVCGATLSLLPGQPANCEACGRHYADDVVTGGMETLVVTARADTAQVPSADSPAPPVAKIIEPEVDPLIGQELGHFKIIDRLGSGGMGSVYRALDESLQRYVALKVITAPHRKSESDTGTSTLDRQIGALLREARAQARVRHPNVVHIYYVSREEDVSEVPFLAMELVEGGTLADGLARMLPTFAQTVDIAIQAAEALRQSAKFDIVHGDVKPSNILLDSDGTVRLSDFGIARRLSAEDAAEVTGTPNYMSPEVCKGEAPDSRSDQYSLGVMLFEMTFGRLPYSFPGPTIDARKEAHLTFVPEFPDPWPATLPEGWRDFLQRLLQKNPDDRFPDYESLIAALRALRPVSLPPAGRLNRSMAWAVDIFLVLSIAGLLSNIPRAFARRLAPGAESAPPEFFLPLIAAGVLIGVAFLQARWGNSLGKKIFQMGIVDLHGLPSGRTRRISRTFFQYFPLWALAALEAIRLAGFPDLSGFLAFFAVIFLAVDAGFAIFRPDRRSLHDLMFKTKVTLSAHPQKGDAVASPAR